MIGVKKFIEEFKDAFNKEDKALKLAKKKLQQEGYKANKEQIEEEKLKILGEWERKTKRGENVQKEFCEKELRNNKNAVIDKRYDLKNSSLILSDISSKLENNKTYLEKCLISTKYNIIGYADKIDVYRNTINIIDNKVIEKIYRSATFKTDSGYIIQGEKMFAPLNHLDQCNYNDMVLQLSLYMYLAWENNKNLKIGKLFINQIHMNDADKRIKPDELIEVPYMKKEIISMLKYKKLNES